ncbi:putative protein sda1 [Glarea lozoyensis 74030]|uniref:Protein SDA1 n=1 Tax=Glarea lozoyensis (strain ATCC 74030 / MF5533) TaxID=1104152 RepID=H0ENQ0_GLAL7|nr:putative protein sda1 [Glarea lozoyensis 74030]
MVRKRVGALEKVDADLTKFVETQAHVSDCFPEDTAEFPEDLKTILTLHHAELESELREKITALFNLLTSDRTSSKGIWAVKITRELWKRQIWTDAKAVEIMKEASLADNEKVIGGGVRFFLGGDKEREELEDESSDDEAIDVGKLKHQAGINKKNKKAKRTIEDAVKKDLVMYRKSKDKGTMMAAKGLLSLYREVGADMLKKRDRGKTATMGIKSGSIKERRFGEEDAGGIEGLELLEQWKADERKRKRAERGLPELGTDEEDNEDDEAEEQAGWDNWDAESDASDDSGGWIAVDSDDEINISDSDDDQPSSKKVKLDTAAKQPETEEEKEKADAVLENKISKLATTKILTPADLAKLQELRLEASMNKAMGKNKTQAQRLKEIADRHADDALTADQIEGFSKLRKSTKEEMIALAREGKGERGEHKSTQALRRAKKDAEGKSTTNKEKARKKNFLMTLGKAKYKQKRSLTQTRRVLKGHIERSKRGGKRGNIGM